MNNIDTILQSADLPEIPVETLSDERQAKILSGALQLVHQDAKKHSRRRVVRIVAAAAAAIAVLCGAAAIWHYASVSTEETVYHTEDTRTLSDGTEVTYFEDFTSDSIIRIDTEGRTEGTYCGVQFGWLPAALIPDHTAYLYDVIANRDPEQLDGISESQLELARTCVYSCLLYTSYCCQRLFSRSSGLDTGSFLHCCGRLFRSQTQFSSQAHRSIQSMPREIRRFHCTHSSKVVCSGFSC